MKRILELTQQRGQLAEQAKLLLKKSEDEKRALTAEESQQYSKLVEDIHALTRTITAITQEAEIESIVGNARDQRRQLAAPGTAEEAEQRRRDAFGQLLRRGMYESAVDEELREYLEPGRSGLLNFRLDQNDANRRPERRAAQSELTGNLGGYIVPTGFWNQVIEALKWYGGVFEAGPTIITTAMGNDLDIPTENDTAIMGQELAESSPETTQEKTFGQVVMKAYKYSSRMILMPIELLQDSGVDIEGLIVRNLATRLGRIQNLRFTTGDGNGRPRGLLLDAAAGVVAGSGHVSDITYNNLVDLKYSVNRAYRRNAKWMFNDDTLVAILKIVDQNNRPLILDYLNTLQADEPERLLGQPIVINSDMPDLGASNKAILYGDFSNYWIRRVMALLMMRLTERYAEAGQVAYLGFMRTDGRMVDAGTHPIKYFQNAAS